MVIHNGASLFLDVLPNEHLEEEIFTHSIGKKTEAQRSWVLGIKVRVVLEFSSFS